MFKHNGKNYSRKLIALSAANKDGGAHVDSSLDKYYEVLAAGQYAFGLDGKNLTYSGDPPFDQGKMQYANNAHLAAAETVRL